MRIWPYLYEYFKTNYFTFILLCVVVSCILMKYLPHGDCFRRSQDGKKTRRLLLVVCLLGILLRVGWLSFCEYRPAFHWDEVLHGEQTWTEYDEINITAEAMTHGVWFRGWNHAPQARRPIGYPVFFTPFLVPIQWCFIV